MLHFVQNNEKNIYFADFAHQQVDGNGNGYSSSQYHSMSGLGVGGSGHNVISTLSNIPRGQRASFTGEETRETSNLIIFILSNKNLKMKIRT